MAQSACGGMPIGPGLRGVEDAAIGVVSGNVVAGLPYRVGVRVGFIMHEDVYNEEPEARKQYYDTLGKIGECEIKEQGYAGIYKLIGAANIPQMTTAERVSDIKAAIFRIDPDEVAAEVNDDIVEGLKQALKANQALVVTVFDPPNGVPEDVYEEMARHLFALGAETVYHRGGAYQKTAYQF